MQPAMHWIIQIIFSRQKGTEKEATLSPLADVYVSKTSRFIA